MSLEIEVDYQVLQMFYMSWVLGNRFMYVSMETNTGMGEKARKP